MKLKIFILVFMILSILPRYVSAQRTEWLVKLKQMEWMSKVSKIQLLKTTRAEVEKILGKPDIRGYEKANFLKTYITENGEIDVKYTIGECNSTSGKIIKDTVEKISFYPKQDILFSTLKLPIKEFTKSRFSDTFGYNYENKMNGVSIAVHEDKSIDSIVFTPPDWEKINCPD